MAKPINQAAEYMGLIVAQLRRERPFASEYVISASVLAETSHELRDMPRADRVRALILAKESSR